MTEQIVWQGKAQNPKGLTAFHFYDNDTEFQGDAPKVADWCARRLGYPTVEVEMVDVHFFVCFEEAVTEYGHQVNQFNIREYMFNLQGRELTGSLNLTGKNIIGNPLPFLTLLSSEYGTEVGAGGEHTWKTGSISVVDGKSTYDLQDLWADVSESGSRLEVRRVFHDVLPPIQRIFGAHGGLGPGGSGLSVPGVSGGGMNSFLSEFGFDRVSPAINFVLLPAYEDVLRIQAIQFNDMIRRSAFSFELTNNNIRLFPTPSDTFTLYFHYTVREERLEAGVQEGVISDYANAPYENIEYKNINDVGRRWIFRYALACAKDILGLIRSKYQTVPIPNSELVLDGNALRQEASAEKETLIKEIRETLEETGRQKQLEKQAANQKSMREIHQHIPNFIYIG